MVYQIGIENNVEGRSMAWALAHPGCFAYGADGNAALLGMPDSVAEYAAWINKHNAGQCWLDTNVIEIHHADTWDVYFIDENYDRVNEEGYEVNAWFRYDWRPLSNQDVERGLKLLSWSREDLLSSVDGLNQDALEKPYPGERWNIAGILNHVGGAEWWYMDRLGMSKRKQDIPDEPFRRLEVVRSNLQNLLPEMVDTKQVLGVDGEFWSPRKMLRRAVWHERDHTSHIRKLAGR